jgi:hypothetical protein
MESKIVQIREEAMRRLIPVLISLSIILLIQCSTKYTREDWSNLPNKDFSISKVEFTFGSKGSTSILYGSYKYEENADFHKKLFQIFPAAEISSALSKRYKIKLNANDLIAAQKSKSFSDKMFKPLIGDLRVYKSTWEKQNPSPNRAEIFIDVLKGPAGQTAAEISFEYRILVYVNNSQADEINLNYISEIGKIGLYEGALKKRQEMAHFFGLKTFPKFKGVSLLNIKRGQYLTEYEYQIKDSAVDSDKLDAYLTKIFGEYFKIWIKSKSEFGS